ncbi:MAG: alpha/beta fold hydrolase, partial [Chloroflexi bacterium]|nr:alpha/beta fold hydrolase [Chloroflexota bacterium]
MIRALCLLTCLFGLLRSAPVFSQGALPNYEVGACPEIVLWMAFLEVDLLSCGYLHVLEDRAAGEDSARLRLFVLRLAAQIQRDNPPVIYLAGGPGDAASASLGDLLGSPLRTWNELILIDQRGTGFSQPSLNCAENDEMTSEDSLATCRARMLAAGINLAAYHTVASAQDVQDLLIALDLPVANIYGISYGTRLALTL